MKAIETTYGGHRFRSRLEARWAVWLDHVGVNWEYESEGFEVGARLSLRDENHFYLPDFWLPDLHLYAEVKGSLDDGELYRLLDIAAGISASTTGGGCTGPVNDFIVLGPIPHGGWNTTTTTLPTRLHMHKGDLQASGWSPLEVYGGCWGGQTIAYDVGGDLDTITDVSHVGLSFETGQDLAGFLLHGGCGRTGDQRVLDAYTAARQARFEHGQTPKRPPGATW